MNTDGSVIVTGAKRPPVSPESVKVYLSPPEKYEVIGLVDAQGDGWDEQGKADAAIAELKKQAAKVGANGILITATGDKSAGSAGVLTSGGIFIASEDYKKAAGKAIWVTQP